jgi:hypothetical protein
MVIEGVGIGSGRDLAGSDAALIDSAAGLELILPDEPGRKAGGTSSSFLDDGRDRSLPLDGGALPKLPSCLLEGLDDLSLFSGRRDLWSKLLEGP